MKRPSDMRRNTAAVPNMMDPREWLSQHLAEAGPDFVRSGRGSVRSTRCDPRTIRELWRSEFRLHDPRRSRSSTPATSISVGAVAWWLFARRLHQIRLVLGRYACVTGPSCRHSAAPRRAVWLVRPVRVHRRRSAAREPRSARAAASRAGPRPGIVLTSLGDRTCARARIAASGQSSPSTLRNTAATIFQGREPGRTERARWPPGRTVCGAAREVLDTDDIDVS